MTLKENLPTRNDREQEIWKKAQRKYGIEIGRSLKRIDLINWNMLGVTVNQNVMGHGEVHTLQVFTYTDKEAQLSTQLSKCFKSEGGPKGYLRELIEKYGDETE